MDGWHPDPTTARHPAPRRVRLSHRAATTWFRSRAELPLTALGVAGERRAPSCAWVVKGTRAESLVVLGGRRIVTGVAGRTGQVSFVGRDPAGKQVERVVGR